MRSSLSLLLYTARLICSVQHAIRRRADHAPQTAFLKGEISTVRSLQEKVDQLESALDRLRKEVQEAEDEEMAQRKAADQLKEDAASLKVPTCTVHRYLPYTQGRVQTCLAQGLCHVCLSPCLVLERLLHPCGYVCTLVGMFAMWQSVNCMSKPPIAVDCCCCRRLFQLISLRS